MTDPKATIEGKGVEAKEATSGFTDDLPVRPIRIAPGEYKICSVKGPCLFYVDGAAFAEWICDVLNNSQETASLLLALKKERERVGISESDTSLLNSVSEILDGCAHHPEVEPDREIIKKVWQGFTSWVRERSKEPSLIARLQSEKEKVNAERNKYKRRALLFRDAYKEKDFQAFALDIQKSQLESLGADKTFIKQREGLQAELLKVCRERNEALSSLAQAQQERDKLQAKLTLSIEACDQCHRNRIDEATEQRAEIEALQKERDEAQEAQEMAERQLYFLRGIFTAEGKEPEDAAKAIQWLIDPLSEDDRKTFNMLIRWARMLGKSEGESRVVALEKERAELIAKYESTDHAETYEQLRRICMLLSDETEKTASLQTQLAVAKKEAIEDEVRINDLREKLIATKEDLARWENRVSDIILQKREAETKAIEFAKSLWLQETNPSHNGWRSLAPAFSNHPAVDYLYSVGLLEKERDLYRWTAATKEENIGPHIWTDARNETIVSGEICLNCGAVRAGNETAAKDEKKDAPSLNEQICACTHSLLYHEHDGKCVECGCVDFKEEVKDDE